MSTLTLFVELGLNTNAQQATEPLQLISARLADALTLNMARTPGGGAASCLVGHLLAPE